MKANGWVSGTEICPIPYANCMYTNEPSRFYFVPNCLQEKKERIPGVLVFEGRRGQNKAQQQRKFSMCVIQSRINVTAFLVP